MMISNDGTKRGALAGVSMRSLIVATALGAVLVVASAWSSEALAKKIEDVRKLPSFTKIEASGSSDVIIKVGKKQSVVVHAEDDEVSEIKTKVTNGELKIWRKNKRMSFSRHSARIVITVPALTRLVSQGSGDASVSNMKAKKFKLVQQGSGDVDITGTCDEIDITSQGSGDLESARLDCDIIDVSLRGSGDMDLEVVTSKSFALDAVGSGDVTISGSCNDFDLEHRASGDVDARRFKCKKVAVDATGSGDMRVFASDEVSIGIRGSGDVEVYGGGRATEISTSGSGSVHVRK
jgi:hypothetical protein